MRARAVLSGLVALSACVTPPAPPNALPPGYPPKIGEVTAELNGTAQHWETYDYSIGAFDAAVQVMGYNEELQFRLLGAQVGKPEEDSNRLFIKAVMTRPTVGGGLTKPVIEIVAGRDTDGLRLSSIGSPTEVVLDRITAKADGAYGHVTGHFSTMLCGANGDPARIDRKTCQPFHGSFSSDLQFDDIERFQP
ncbi:MAG: hypothetical protein ABI832_07525 [bacterium]